jgi:Spy/CpxP family protein refolding chaperone
MIFSFKTRLNLMLSIAVLTLSNAAIAPIVHASGKSMPHTISQDSSGSGAPAKPKIVLTDKQKEQIQAIKKNENSQIIAILTPEQQAIIQKAANSGTASSGSIEAELKLTKEQEAKIAAIQTQSKKQLEAVLTPEQIQILKSRSTPSTPSTP